MNKKHLFYFLSVLIFLVFIAPFIYASNFVPIISDDVCRAITPVENIISEWRSWYISHNGRYINALFSFLPVYDIETYRLVLAIQFIFLGVILYLFITKLFLFYNADLTRPAKILLSLLVYITLIAQLPSLFQEFYWYAAVTAYLWSFFFLVILIGIVLEYIFLEKLRFWALAFLLILINGNNEILLGVTNITMFALLIRQYILFKNWNLALIFLNLVSWISSLVLIFSPGTISRRGEYNYGGNLLGSVKVAFIYGGKYILENLFQFPYFLLYFLFFLFVYDRVSKTKKISFLHPGIFLFFSYLSFISLCFIIYYATGLLEIRTGRIGNIFKMVLILFIILNLANTAAFAKEKEWFAIRYNIFSQLAVTLVFVFILSFNNSYVNLRNDFSNRAFERLEGKMEERIMHLQQSTADTVTLISIPSTKILDSGDYTLMNEEWAMECYIEYLNNFYQLDIRYLKIDEVK